MCAKFEDNLITHLHFMAVFLQVCKKFKRIGKSKEENEGLLKAHTVYLRIGWHDLLQIWCVVFRYASTCTENFKQEITELQTCVNRMVHCSLC